MGAEARFFFVHVQKAAGTSLFVRMQRQFPREQIYPDDSDIESAANAEGAVARLPKLAPTLLVSHLVERYHLRRDAIRVVAGHFPLRTTELLGDPFITVTILREPVERILSALQHQRVRSPADRERPLEELYDDPIRFHGLLHNHMVKMFSLSPDEILFGDGVMAPVEQFTPARTEEAKARLEGVHTLGLDDRIEELAAELTERYGWRLGPSVHANRTEPVEVPASFRARIEADNAADVELYEHARELWSARRGGAPKFTPRGQGLG